jgi:hypothetical protein
MAHNGTTHVVALLYKSSDLVQESEATFYSSHV